MADGGMTNEDAVRAAATALDEVTKLMRGAFLSTAEAEPDGYEATYILEQLSRIGDHADWLRDHLDNLTDPEFVTKQSKRMADRDARRRGDA